MICQIQIFKTHKRIKEKNDVKIYTIESNLEDSDSRQSAIKKILKEHKKLNILINTAALVGSTPLDGWATSFEKQSLETWDRAFKVNLFQYFTLEGLVPLIKKSGNGSTYKYWVYIRSHGARLFMN